MSVLLTAQAILVDHSAIIMRLEAIRHYFTSQSAKTQINHHNTISTRAQEVLITSNRLLLMVVTSRLSRRRFPKILRALLTGRGMLSVLQRMQPVR